MKADKKYEKSKGIIIKCIQEEDLHNLYLYLYLLKNEIKRREIKYAESI